MVKHVNITENVAKYAKLSACILVFDNLDDIRINALGVQEMQVFYTSERSQEKDKKLRYYGGKNKTLLQSR